MAYLVIALLTAILAAILVVGVCLWRRLGDVVILLAHIRLTTSSVLAPDPTDHKSDAFRSVVMNSPVGPNDALTSNKDRDVANIDTNEIRHLVDQFVDNKRTK